MIDIGELAGSGIPKIFRVWRSQKWSEPTITQIFSPDRTPLSLPLSPMGTTQNTLGSIGKNEVGSSNLPSSSSK